MARDVLAQQTALYGEPLSARFGRMLAAYGIPQSRLAAVLGLSAPMLSQLASGQRVKIGNPAVLGRLLRLEELANTPTVRSGDPAQIQAALDAVAASRPQLSTGLTVAGGNGPGGAIEHLIAVAGEDELRRAAGSVPGSRLAALLHAAADRAR